MRRIVILAVPLYAALPGWLPAQTPHEECAATTAALRAGPDHPRYLESLQRTDVCRETGAEALALVWRRAAPRSEREVELLFAASDRLRDQRIAEEVLRVAEDRSVQRVVRLNALRILAAYVEPSLSLRMEYMVPDPDGRKLAGTSVSHPHRTPGAVPLSADLPSRVRALLDELSEDADHPDVQWAAGLVRRLLGHRLPPGPAAQPDT